MCLIVFAVDCHADYRLILAANRDEFYRRPTAAAEFWPESPQVLAGRDLEAGGTWLGVTRGGRIAALTNYRDPAAHRPAARSRGELVANFLGGSLPPGDYLAAAAAGRLYNGFNLLVGDDSGLFYYSNREGIVRPVTPGIHGLSNHLLDSPWPKVERAKAALAACVGKPGRLDFEALFALLADRQATADDILPDTGVGLAWERLLSPVFIASPDYGTRSSTVLAIDRRGRAVFRERSWPDGSERTFRFECRPAARPRIK